MGILHTHNILCPERKVCYWYKLIILGASNEFLWSGGGGGFLMHVDIGTGL